MRFLILATVLLASPLASAQIGFGLKGGLNTTFFGGPSSEGLDPALGGVGGAVVRLDANPGFGIAAEALYSQKGARDEFLDETYRFTYLEVPVYARLAVPVGPFMDAGVQIGGYVGVPLNASVVEEDFEVDANTDYGAMIGLDVGAGSTYVEARYSLGLAQVTDDPDLFTDLEEGAIPDLKNQAVSLTFGLRF